MAGTTRTLYLAIFSAVLGMLQYGFGIGVINAPQTLIQEFIKQSFKSRYDTILDDSKAKFWFSLAVNGAIVGGLLGAISGGSIANKFGRQRGLLIAQGPSLLGSILMGISKTTNSFELLLIGRTLFGISCGWFTALAPMYVSEIAPVNIRGAMGTINQLSVTGGILVSMVLGLSEVLGTDKGWPILLALSAVPALVQLALLPLMPESPSFLISVKKDVDSGKKALERLTGYKGDNIDELANSLAGEETEQESMSILKLLMERPLHLSLFVCICLHLSQQLSGMVAIFYYSTTFFQSAGLDMGTSQYATIGVGAILVTMTFITIPLMDRLGRRILHLVGLAGIMACSIAITIALTLQSRDVDNKNLGVFLVAATLIFVAFFAFGPGSIPWMAAGEMFTQESRGAATSVCVFVNWLGNLTVGLVFPLLQDTITTYSFVPFLVITTVLFFVLLIYFPETKGISPNQLQAILSSPGAWGRPVGLRKRSASLLTGEDSQQNNLQASYGTLNSEIEGPKGSPVTNI